MADPWQIPAPELDRLANAVAEAIPTIVARIPATPAAAMGRMAVADSPIGLFMPQPGNADQRLLTALRSLNPLLAERLLGALELFADDITVEPPGGLTDNLPEPRTRSVWVSASASTESETVRSVTLLDNFRPGTSDLVLELTNALRRHETVAAVLTTAGRDEAEVAAYHGAVHIGLALAVASAVAKALNVPVARSVPAVVGLALGAAAAILPDLPMPAAYAPAVLAKRRAEYLYPQSSWASAAVPDHWFALAEGPIPDEPPDFSANGLVTRIPGGAVIRTGVTDNPVRIMLRVVAEPPEDVGTAVWDEVVDISWTATTGAAALSNVDRQQVLTPPWPGDYRLRVHARGRDGDDDESYELTVWRAPEAPQTVHERTDRLGHRLRGEPEPVAVVPPEAAYRWVEPLMAATITIATGISASDVLRAFRADPEVWLSREQAERRSGRQPMVSVLPLDGAVLAVEDNGWRGSEESVLRALSINGSAASMYWNVEGLRQLSFARDGELLATFEPGINEVPTEVAPLLDDLNLADYRHLNAKGVTAVARFTGHGFGQEHFTRIEEADVIYPLTDTAQR